MEMEEVKRRRTGPGRSPKSIRNSGWRAPLLPKEFAQLTSLIGQRKEYQGQSLRVVVQAALMAHATPEEKAKAGL